ncbi:Uncharacterized oxidoreductase HI_0048 [Actinobacillus equuli]|nr:Uncharacterized oxidoreductase HI_0048 [Actinobacillus equuli]
MTLARNHNFKDKVVVITGAGGVLCAYFAKEIAKPEQKLHY